METDVTRSIEEQLSAFLDGELPDEELQLLVRRLEREESFRATLVRYSLLGNILRNDPIQSSSEPFRARIMATISSEDEVAGSEYVDEGVGFKWGRPLVSAAVVAIVFVGVVSTGMFDNAVESDIAGAATAGLSAAPGDAKTNEQRVRVVANVPPQLDRKASLNQERLTSYLVSHSERARPFQGPMADSRIFIQQASFEQ